MKMFFAASFSALFLFGCAVLVFYIIQRDEERQRNKRENYIYDENMYLREYSWNKQGLNVEEC